ncbi:MAG: hypothetical protein NTU59_08365 [Coprothermobacterota bacterium]|nr:hypothetical protein [Coprothermobacterota bacterium]
MMIAIKTPEAMTVGVGLWGGDSVGVGDTEALGDSEEEGEGDPDSEGDSDGEGEGDEFKAMVVAVVVVVGVKEGEGDEFKTVVVAVVVGCKEGVGELVGVYPW